MIVDGIKIGAGGSRGTFCIYTNRESVNDSDRLRCHGITVWFIDHDDVGHLLLDFYIFTPEEAVDDDKVKNVVLAELARESFPVNPQ